MKRNQKSARKGSAFLAAALVLAALSCGKSPDPGPAAEGKGPGAAASSGAMTKAGDRSAPSPESGPNVLYAAVFVNGARAATLTPDLPVIVAVNIGPADAETKWTPGDAARVSLTIADADGKPVSVEAESLPAAPAQAGRGADATLRWVLKAPLPKGHYEIGLSLPDDWIDKAKAGIDEIRIEPASLQMGEGTAAASQKAYWERRALLARSRFDEYLKSVKEALAAAPQDGNLKFELVEGMALSGDRKGAAKELAGLLTEMQEAQRKARPDKEPHIPAWLMDYLTALEKQEANAGPLPSVRGPAR